MSENHTTNIEENIIEKDNIQKINNEENKEKNKAESMKSDKVNNKATSYKSSLRKSKMNSRLRYILLTTLLPIFAFLVVMIILMVAYVQQYYSITHNINVSSQFSLTFKTDLDLKMYHYAIKSNQQKTLPIEEVERAEKIAKSLEATTTRQESKLAIKNILEYCEKLKQSMYQFNNDRQYTQKIAELETNSYVLTDLIQECMQDYIYYEAQNLATAEQRMKENLWVLLIAVTFISVVTIFVLLRRAFLFTYDITKPIEALCENVRMVGQGDFDIEDVEYENVEVELLNDGIMNMTKQIEQLLENVKEDEKEYHKMSLQLLQAQINPHFLYNTLDTIVWLVEAGRQEDAVHMLTQLSMFFRTTLSKGMDIITLEEEMMHTKSYLEIQSVRYHDIMEYDISYPEQLKEIRLPKLTIQPLAENALYHGVKEKRGKSRIDIRCVQENEEVYIIVKDTGIGMKDEKLNEMQHALDSGERVGFGLVTVHERIKLYCGEEYGITIKSQYGEGTEIKVKISRDVQVTD